MTPRTELCVSGAIPRRDGAFDSEVLKEVLVKDWDAGKIVFDELFTELTGAGWRLYTPQEDWFSPKFQTQVR
jgi:hypothetical protein